MTNSHGCDYAEIFSPKREMDDTSEVTRTKPQNREANRQTDQHFLYQPNKLKPSLQVY